MASIHFNKEVTRFTFLLKQEILQDVLKGFAAADPVVDGGLEAYIKAQVETIATDLGNFDKKHKMGANKRKDKSSTPRPMSAYNKFIKKVLPDIAKELPALSNKERMTNASQKWKKLTVKEKEAYKLIEF